MFRSYWASFMCKFPKEDWEGVLFHRLAYEAANDTFHESASVISETKTLLAHSLGTTNNQKNELQILAIFMFSAKLVIL